MISDEGQIKAAVAMQAAAEQMAQTQAFMDESLNRILVRFEDAAARLGDSIEKAVDRLIVRDQFPH